MKIETSKELRFFIMADRIMNGFAPYPNCIEKVKELFRPQRHIVKFLYYMRCLSYHKCKGNKLRMIYYRWLYNKKSLQLGFSIDYNVFSYGLVIPHYGTIVVGGPNKIGSYAVLHTSTCIAGSGKEIGTAFYLGSGSQCVGELTLGDNVSVASHSLVNKSFESNVLLAGAPAKIVRSSIVPWYERDGMEYKQRIEKVEKLKKELNV